MELTTASSAGDQLGDSGSIARIAGYGRHAGQLGDLVRIAGDGGDLMAAAGEFGGDFGAAFPEAPMTAIFMTIFP